MTPAFAAPLPCGGARRVAPRLCAASPRRRSAARASAAPGAGGASAVSDARARVRAGSRPDALLTVGLPKGSLLDATLGLLGRAGWAVRVKERSYYASVDDEELNLVMFRSQEMARYVESGAVDCGITGLDWVLESGVGERVVDVASLNYSKASDGCVRWVLAVPEASEVRCAADLAGATVSTELVETTRRYFEARGVAGVRCEFSWGATEIKARAQLVDAICDVTETGNSIRANNLRVVDTVMESSTRLIANADAWADPARRAKIEEVALLLNAALHGRRRCGIKMNVPVGAVDEVTQFLAQYAITSPTVASLVDGRYVSMEIITEKKAERLVIPRLKALGCLGIFSYNLNMLVA